MSTESIERDITISSEAYEKTMKIMNEPIKYKKDNSSDIMKEIEEGKKVLEKLFNKDDELLTLQQIQEKNRTETTLLGSEIIQQEHSDKLINQCKEEFETFVKPIRGNVMNRYNNK